MNAPGLDRRIVIIGAGGIVRDAHLPAYIKAGFRVAGIYDLVRENAAALAGQYGIPCFADLGEAIAAAAVEDIFDVAVPADCTASVLRALPVGRGVLMQKPMGEDLAQARAIRDLCRAKGFTAAVNFQLRFSPAVEMARSMIAGGRIGDLVDMEVRITAFTPWHLWPALEHKPRVEILYHSIHYIDLVRSFLGDPPSVYARCTRHPLAPRLASTRSTIVMDYGDDIRANIAVHHGHAFGPRHQESFVKWEGTRGAIQIQLGLMLDYPRGRDDSFEYVIVEEGKPPEWIACPVEGSWFPDAFGRRMASLMAYMDGSISTLDASVEDAYRTMAVVEAAYESNHARGVQVRYD